MTKSFSLPTARLKLRDYEPGDLAVVRAVFLDPAQAHCNLTGQADEAYVAEHFGCALAQRAWQPRPAWDLAAVLPSGETIGLGGLKLDRRSSGAQLSYHIQRAYGGRGYATEAAARLLEFGFLGLGLAVIEANAFADNAASIRVMEKIGLRPAHNGDIACWWRGLTLGEQRPVVSYQLQKEAWLAERLRQAASQPLVLVKAA